MRGKGRATDTARRGTASSEGTKVLSHAGERMVLTSAVPVAAIATAAIVIAVEESKPSKGRGIKHKP